MRRFIVLIAVVLLVGVLAPVALTALPPGGTFADDDLNTHEGNIEAIASVGVTKGCTPAGTLYCPSDLVTRGQMASFLARAFALPAAVGDHFSDDNGTTHEANINRIYEAGITTGFPDGTYQPDGFVTREQMGSFIARAMGLTPIPGDRFGDVAGTHEANINAIATAGVTLGCNPAGTLYCPKENVKRDQMASFIARALGLAPIYPPIPVYLADLKPVDYSRYPGQGAVNVDGDTYARSVKWFMNHYDSGKYVEYDLGRSFKSLCAVVGVADNSDSPAALQLEVLGDGVSLGTFNVALGQPAHVSVDVSNRLRLRLEARSSTTTKFYGEAVWGKIYVTNTPNCDPPVPDPSPKPNPKTYLTDLSTVDYNSTPSKGVANIDGVAYPRTVRWHMYHYVSGRYVEYDASRDFKRICATVGPTDESDAATSFVAEIYADGVSVFSRSVSLGNPASVDVPIAGALRIRLEASSDTTTNYTGKAAWGDVFLSTSDSCG